MEFRDVVRRRRMVRRFERRELDPAQMERILAHGHRAPTAGFTQGYAFLLLADAADRERFWALRGRDGDAPAADESVQDAPVLIVPMASKAAYLARYAEPDKGWTDRDEARWPVPFWYIDAGFAALLMLLTAVDEGLGACFFGIPPSVIEPFRAAFAVPPDYDPIGCIAVGHPLPEPPSDAIRRRRRTLEVMVHLGRWGGGWRQGVSPRGDISGVPRAWGPWRGSLAALARAMPHRRSAGKDTSPWPFRARDSEEA